MSQPTVSAVMLTADRPAYARRAVEAFRAQTYPRRCLFVLDTTPGAGDRPPMTDVTCGEFTACADQKFPLTIGELRNEANRAARVVFEANIVPPEIIVHWDDDDYSHLERIAEQVELLQASGADLVGYNEMLFWRDDTAPGNKINLTGEAWLYTGSILGTSMCYWRKTWERVPFEAHGHHNEDTGFALHVQAAGMKVVTESAIKTVALKEGSTLQSPAMIARIHAGNASNPAYDPAQMRAHPQHWRRAPEWDSLCRATMEGECAAAR